MSTVLDPVIDKPKSSIDEPLIHLFDGDDPSVALCGVSLKTHRDLPWHRGIHDCRQCWAIHDLEMAGEI